MKNLLTRLNEDAILVVQVILGGYAMGVIEEQPIYAFIALVLLLGSAFLRHHVKKSS